MVIKLESNYPLIYFSCELVDENQSLFDLGGYHKAKEFNNFDEITKKCKYINDEYTDNDFRLILYGVKDLKLIKTFFKKIKTNKKLTFESIKIKIHKFDYYIYMTEEDGNNGNEIYL